MPVWLENEAPTTMSRSDSFISQLATGVPLRPSTPGAERVGVGDQALGLERGEHRRAEPLGERDDLGRGRRGRRGRRRSPAGGRRGPAPRPRPARRRRADPARLASRPPGRGGLLATAAPAPRRAAPGARRRGRRSRASPPARPARRGRCRRCTAWSRRATSSNTADRSRSWKAPRPSTFDGTCPEIAITGDWSSLASYRPVSRLVEPGPAIAKQAAGRPVSLPYALAANAAAPSCRIPM